MQTDMKTELPWEAVTTRGGARRHRGAWRVAEAADAAHLVVEPESGASVGSSASDLEECLGVLLSLKSRGSAEDLGKSGTRAHGALVGERASTAGEDNGYEIIGRKDTDARECNTRGATDMKSSKLPSSHATPRCNATMETPAVVRRIQAPSLPKSARLRSAVAALLIRTLTPGALASRPSSVALMLVGTAAIAIMTHLGYGLLTVGILVSLQLCLQYVSWRRTFSPTPEYFACEEVADQISGNGSTTTAPHTVVSYGQRNVVMSREGPSHRRVWAHPMEIENSATRGMSTVGMPFLSYLWATYVFGFEFTVNILGRCILYDLGLCRTGKDTVNCPKRTYQVLVNTAMAAYIDSTTGNCVIDNLSIPADNDRAIFLPQVTFHLQHTSPGTVTMVTVRRTVSNQGQQPEVIEVWSEDPDDIATLAVYCLAEKVHGPATHMWANGVKEIEKIWPLATEANDLAQWFNYAGMRAANFAVPTSVTAYSATLASNFQDGFPMHNHLPKHILEQSKMHKMAVACRNALQQMWGPAVPRWILNAVLATTVYHSADHYYLDHFTANNGQCGLLGMDITIQFLCLIGPNRFFVTKTLCRERLEDPVCRALYEACLPIDPDFANHGLTFSISS